MKTPGNIALNIWRWINILSLDVCAGAIAGGIMATMIFGSSPGWAYWLILPLAVWLIYTADHLIDGYRAGANAQHERRLLHRDHLKILAAVSAVLIPLIASIAFLFLPGSVIIFGICLGILVLVYLVLVFFIGKRSASFLPKELIVALIYTAGIWGPVIIIKQSIILIEGLVAIMYFLLALSNLFMLSIIEVKVDKAEGQCSFPLSFGVKRARILFNLFTTVVIIVSILLISTGSSWLITKAAIITGLMSICFLLIYSYSNQLEKNDVYRYISEAVFFLPILILV